MTDDSNYRVPDEAPEPERRGASLPGQAFDSLLPANVDAEKTILGAVLLDNAAFNEAAEHLEADHFSLDSHRRIFLRMSELVDAGQAVDIVTLSNELARQKEVETVGGVAYLASLTEGLPRRPVIGEYIKIVKDKSQLRRLMAICSSVIARAVDQSESAMTVLEDCEGQLLEIAQEANVGKLTTVYDSVERAGGTDEYLKPIVNPDVQPGTATGFYDLDRLTGGFKNGELILLAARPSMGKSALCLNFAENICIGTNAVVAIFSLEMSQASLERRLLAGIARVDVRRATTGEYLSNTEREKLNAALAKLIESQIHIDDTPSLTVTQMRAKARRLKQRMGRMDLIEVDYLQMARSSGKHQNRQEEVASISRSLKALAKEMSCPVVALSQVARSSEQRQDKRPTLADLRESGAQEADADVVLLVHRPEYFDRDNPELKGIAELICAKNREGPTGLVKLAYIPEFTRFENLSRGAFS